MSSPDTNYFVCTLGEAAQDGIARPFSNVNQLIETQAEQNPDRPAIGFYDTSQQREGEGSTGYRTTVLTYREVRDGVLATATLLRETLSLKEGQTIGLLSDSSPAFFFVWLGCIRLGLAVLLVAPQCSPSAIASLCGSCQVSIVFVDAKHEALAAKACSVDIDSEEPHLQYKLLPVGSDDDVFEVAKRQSGQDLPMPTAKQDDIAYLHHTSGTSSGVPKPIPQTHHGAVGVLPALDCAAKATFTTTPLYHGGPADIFRAWSSAAMIWLFPSQAVPVTPSNIIKCLTAAESVSDEIGCSVKYFTSVPYILQMMAADDEGLKWLQRMDLVGVGGAALPVEVGNKLVDEAVRLVSRFGSAECGFLLSSHRNYGQDTEWQYLRLNGKVAQLKFEFREEDLHELVVKSDWPHMAKRNREDGSFATSDLFAKHPTIPNAFKYHSRADSQLTLVTGKKFDPAPLEDAIVASSPLIADALIFGNGRPYPGVLLFESQNAESEKGDTIFETFAAVIENINLDSQSHARIPRNMLVIMPPDAKALEKSSKGTILRSRAEERYSSSINDAYDRIDNVTNEHVPDDKVTTRILDLVRSLVGSDSTGDLDASSDLFSHGVDSVACVQIRHGLQRMLPGDAKSLPLTVVEDSRTAAELADFILKVRRGESITKSTEPQMNVLQIINQFSQLNVRPESDDSVETERPAKLSRQLTVAMTGPTGSLGSHVLWNLLRTAQVARIYLLVRGKTPQAARERVLKALSSRQLDIPTDFDNKAVILQSRLSDLDLGLSSEDYALIRDSVDLVLHLAWSVNFLLSLASFTQHFAGIQNLLNLCISSPMDIPPKMIFCSSVASVSNFCTTRPSQNVPERIIPDVGVSGPTGYALSKLTAELILSRSSSLYRRLNGRVVIVRVGQLSADSMHGVWNKSEAYPQILASSKLTDGMLPDLGEQERLTWLPVDLAAKAFVEASFSEEKTMANIPTQYIHHKSKETARTMTKIPGGPHQDDIEIDPSTVRVLHLVNPEHRFNFTDFVICLQRFLQRRQQVSQGEANNTNTGLQPVSIKVVPVNEWLEKLQSLQKDAESSDVQQLLRLLPFWTQAYADRKPTGHGGSGSIQSDTSSIPELMFDMHNSLLTMPSMTHWLGRSTLEAAKHRSRLRPNLVIDGENTVVSKSRIYKSDNADRTGKTDFREQNAMLDQSKVAAEVAELLSEEYVLKIWSWIVENVP